MNTETADDATQYRTDDYEIGNRLPRGLVEGRSWNTTLPVYEASESDMPGIEGVRPHTSGGPDFEVKVNMQNLEDDQICIGLWDPEDDDEYLSHGLTASPYRSFQSPGVAAMLADWLDDLLENHFETVERFMEKP